MVHVPGNMSVGACPWPDLVEPNLNAVLVGADHDGTLADYNYEPNRVGWINHALFDHLRKYRASKLAIITNQGGIVSGENGLQRTDGRKYPTVRDFIMRVEHTIHRLDEAKITVETVHVCMYHPACVTRDIYQTADKLSAAWTHAGLKTLLYVHTGEQTRKPSAYMLNVAGVGVFYGDSGIDEQAANNAGIPFVPVERFSVIPRKTHR